MPVLAAIRPDTITSEVEGRLTLQRLIRAVVTLSHRVDCVDLEGRAPAVHVEPTDLRRLLPPILRLAASLNQALPVPAVAEPDVHFLRDLAYRIGGELCPTY